MGAVRPGGAAESARAEIVSAIDAKHQGRAAQRNATGSTSARAKEGSQRSAESIGKWRDLFFGAPAISHYSLKKKREKKTDATRSEWPTLYCGMPADHLRTDSTLGRGVLGCSKMACASACTLATTSACRVRVFVLLD